MALIVGITGGIGSGKTTACRVFEVLGAKVFYADDEAKALYSIDEELKKKVIHAFGEDIYPNGIFSRKNLAGAVFGDTNKMSILNDLVHPALGRAFASWCATNGDKPYLLKEAAILIESGAHEACDNVIVVTCPEDIRLSRVAKRDGISEDSVRERMKHQLSESERLGFASFQINNSGAEPITPQIISIHKSLIDRAETR